MCFTGHALSNTTDTHVSGIACEAGGGGSAHLIPELNRAPFHCKPVFKALRKQVRILGLAKLNKSMQKLESLQPGKLRLFKQDVDNVHPPRGEKRFEITIEHNNTLALCKWMKENKRIRQGNIYPAPVLCFI